MRSRLGLVLAGVVGLLLATGLAVWMAPDAGPDAVVAAVPAPSTAPVPHREVRRLMPGDRVNGVDQEPPREVVRVTQVDPNKLYPASADGLAASAADRRQRLAACWSGYESRAPDDAKGRFTLNAELTPGPDGLPVLGVSASNVAGDDTLDTCLRAAFADVHYERPEAGGVSVLWPVPLPATP